MKKIIFLIITLCLLAKPSYIFAQEPSLVMTVSPTPSVTSPIVAVDYTLPYPGILADNPLYPLKILRDNIIGWLINDPLKKANFDLLQSDKRLQIGTYLIKQDKTKAPLAISTISKGENYLTDSVNKAQQATKQGEATTDILRTLHTAILKHEQVMQMLEIQVSSSQKNALNMLYIHDLQLDKQLLAIK